MNEDQAAAGAILQALLNKTADAKLVPILGMILGLEFALERLFNLLDQKGLLSKQEALAYLTQAREALPPEAPAPVAAVFRTLEMGLALPSAESAAALPKILQTMFEALQPDPTKKPH